MDILISGNFGINRMDLIENMKILLEELVKFESVESY
jgi:hypothetical protein